MLYNQLTTTTSTTKMIEMISEFKFITGENPVCEFILLKNCYYASRTYLYQYWCVRLVVPAELHRDLGIKQSSYLAVVDDFGNLTKVEL